jgi:long-subunit acyl-CoA synthetase (AMP-forming)
VAGGRAAACGGGGGGGVQLQVLPPGQPGELLMKSPLVMSHYHNKPDKTDEALISLEGE